MRFWWIKWEFWGLECFGCQWGNRLYNLSVPCFHTLAPSKKSGAKYKNTPAHCLACRYPSAASGVPQAKKAQWDSFFSLTAFLTAVVHPRVRFLQPRQAPATLRPQNQSAASTMEARNIAQLDSMSPMPPKWSGLSFNSRRWEMKLLLTGDSARRSQQTLTIPLGLPGLTGILSPPPEPTHHQLVVD